MKLKIAWLALLLLALASIPAWAQGYPVYDNGPINGTTDAWTINFGYVVSDTFVWETYGSQLYAFAFGVWEFPFPQGPNYGPCVRCRDMMQSVQWSITSGENGGTVYGAGTASKNGGAGGTLTDKFISVNQYGYDIDLIDVTGLNVPLTNGTKYWLNLQNAAVPGGDPVYWDENSGKGCSGSGCPSQASESAAGTIASEAFSVYTAGCGDGCKLGPSGAPEPGSIVLFGSGVLGLAGLLRCKLHW